MGPPWPEIGFGVSWDLMLGPCWEPKSPLYSPGGARRRQQWPPKGGSKSGERVPEPVHPLKYKGSTPEPPDQGLKTKHGLVLSYLQHGGG